MLTCASVWSSAARRFTAVTVALCAPLRPSVPLPLADAQTEARQQSEKLTAKIGQPFEHDDRLAELARRQDEIIKQLDLTRNQASSQMDSSETQTETQQTSDATNSLRRATMRRATIRV